MKNTQKGSYCSEEEEAKENEISEEGENMELYPKGGLVTIHNDQFSDKGLENNVGKSVMHSDKAHLRERGFTEVTSLTLPLQLRMEKEETARIHQENKDSETLFAKLVETIPGLDLEAEERSKTIRKEEEKIDFFPQ